MLDTIGLTNFKAFRDIQVPLGGLTLLTGVNSSGKSSVLQAMAAIRQSSSLHREGRGRNLLLNGSLIELGNGQDVLHSDWVDTPDARGPYIRLEVVSGEQRIAWNFSYHPEADALPLTAMKRIPAGTAEDAGIRALVGDAGPGSFQYLRADRVSPASTYERSHEAAVEQAFLGPHGEHTVNYLRHHQGSLDVLEGLHHPEARSNTLLSHVEAWLGEISPGVNLDIAGIDRTDMVRLSYGYGGRAGLSSSGPRRPTNVGFGLTYTLPIIVACLTARPGALLLLENPEAHLHPRGQSRVALLLAKAAAAGAQLVVETHSDHVLNGLRLAVKEDVLRHDEVVLHYFRNSGATALASPMIGPDGMVSQWPEGFFDEWDNAVMRLLG
ncbi:putative ATPase [Nocardiopsis sp. Huas11]|uniref:AAA family ATPase n=1 Tax=Nocardiopsis sp. Huas11 TaxID=2183912 RepID=UPI000EAEB463|nr:DUF3696 domain-containing protein [Nocardiopsis sp. Huas11]RKS08865.1 putative ATPase [Nocardiopsis sp. Huas11]